MNRPLNIVVNKNTPQAVEVFSRLGNVLALDTPEVTKEAVRDADVLIVRSETRVDEHLLDSSSVRFVGTVTIGTDHIDLGYLASRGIEFASAPGSNANSVAEYVAAALLVWSQPAGKSLQGKTIGIVGVGNVGSKVVLVARALGMNVLLNDPPLARKTRDPSYRPLDELMDADFITLHVPLTTSGRDMTHHLFEEARIAEMKRGSVLLNTSRGAVVETTALKEALGARHVSTAILDVWENEPSIDPGLLANVLLGTPHIAGYSLDGKLNAVRMVYEALCRYLHRPVQWHLEAERATPPAETMTLPRELTDPYAVAAAAVRQVYDIERDDAMLRRVSSLTEGERGSYFMNLRAEYRVRQEFSTRLVELWPEQEAALEILVGLGFKAFVRKEELRWAQ